MRAMLWLRFRRIYVCHFQDELRSLLGVSRTASSRDSGRFTFAVRDSRSISSYSSAFFQQGARRTLLSLQTKHIENHARLMAANIWPRRGNLWVIDERQPAFSARNRRNFRQVESKEFCWSSLP